MTNRLEDLQEWYSAQCDGEWEHAYGVTILTSDNPAWNVTVDLTGTTLNGAEMQVVKSDNGDQDWMTCGITDNQFGGVGDPSKLGAILDCFFRVAAERGWRRDSSAD